MKKVFLAVLALAALVSTPQRSAAQSEPVTSNRKFSIGPILTFGASTMTGDVATGYKIKPRLAWQFGALGEVDISDAISFDLGLTYESRARYYYSEANEDAFNSTAELGYFTISPLFNFSHFLLGFGIRLPMSGTAIVKSGSTEVNKDIDTDDMKTAIDVKIGGNIPLLNTRGGTLNFIVLAGYDLVAPFKSVPEPNFNPGQPDASLHLGINYLFNAAELK
jgi:hypothetical protein